MYSENLNRLLELVKNDKKMSGILLSKISEDEIEKLKNSYHTHDLPTIIYSIAKNIEIPKCISCNTNFVQIENTKKGFRKFCSVKCSCEYNNKLTNSIKNKTRVEKTSKELLNKLVEATEFYLNHDNTLRDVSKKFNVSYSSLRKHVSKENLIRKDIKSVLHRKKWEQDNQFIFDGTLANLIDEGKSSKIIAEKFDVSPNVLCVYAKKLGLNWKSQSSYETMLEDFLQSHNIDFIRNDRKEIAPYELDFFIPKYNIAIEINGEYWHSDEKKEKTYHLKKQQMAESKNIHLLQFFTHEIHNNREKVFDIISSLMNLNRIKIAARNTEIREIQKNDANIFLSENHLFKYSGASICLGLFKDDQLISVATFRKPRFNSNYDWELIRFVNKISYHVIGGLGKFISYMRKKYTNTTIITYAHRRLFTGKSYEKVGFKLINKTTPGYFWFSNGKVISRFKTQKHKLNTNLSENNYMRSQGYKKIYDCGQLVFELG